ncbi:UNVERIFIED_CONTAM: hypothetical protein RMT77_016073 [Armadillidium vulgare]
MEAEYNPEDTLSKKTAENSEEERFLNPRMKSPDHSRSRSSEGERPKSSQSEFPSVVTENTKSKSNESSPFKSKRNPVEMDTSESESYELGKNEKTREKLPRIVKVHEKTHPEGQDIVEMTSTLAASSLDKH